VKPTRHDIDQQNPTLMNRLSLDLEREEPEIEVKLNPSKQARYQRCILKDAQAQTLLQLLPSPELKNEVLSLVEAIVDRQHAQWEASLVEARDLLVNRVNPVDQQIAALTSQVAVLALSLQQLRSDIVGLSTSN
jgi:hypothetical protein